MNESYEDYRDKGCYGREPGTPKFKPGDFVWIGDIHYSVRCEVLEYHKGGTYTVQDVAGRKYRPKTKDMRPDGN